MRTSTGPALCRRVNEAFHHAAGGVAVGLICAASGAGCSAAPKPAVPDPRAGTIFENETTRPTFLGRVFGRDEPMAPPEPTPLETYQRSRKKALTVPTDTVNALKLVAQDWVLAARERGPRVHRTKAGDYVREYNSFSDKYTLEIERADEKEAATLTGYVFLDATHMVTRAHTTEDEARIDATYREERRKLRMTFRLHERWEFSELADEYVFNRTWELDRVQYKPILASRPPPPAPTEITVSPPQATPRPD